MRVNPLFLISTGTDNGVGNQLIVHHKMNVLSISYDYALKFQNIMIYIFTIFSSQNACIIIAIFHQFNFHCKVLEKLFFRLFRCDFNVGTTVIISFHFLVAL
jgi:hypothetical protein